MSIYYLVFNFISSIKLPTLSNLLRSFNENFMLNEDSISEINNI